MRALDVPTLKLLPSVRGWHDSGSVPGAAPIAPAADAAAAVGTRPQAPDVSNAEWQAWQAHKRCVGGEKKLPCICQRRHACCSRSAGVLSTASSPCAAVQMHMRVKLRHTSAGMVYADGMRNGRVLYTELTAVND